VVTAAHTAGVDAVIVQDIGLLVLLREHFPGIEIHASTQMTSHNAGQLALLAHAGVSQVNLGRELALDEIRALCTVAHDAGIKTEVFVYGAYCISYSGQCYMSCAMSGKSGNRGACVQPCRRIYSYGKSHLKGTALNLKDNSAFTHADELALAGVASFKIEGRIKGYKYVFATVTAWRRQIDRLNADEVISTDDAAFYSVFNRSLSAGYLDGSVSREMFTDSSRDQSLHPVGKIRSYTADTGILRLEREVEIDPETPVLIYAEGFTFVCTGFITERVERFSYRLKITHKLKGKIESGDMLYRQADFDGPADLRARIDALVVKKHPLQISCSGASGSPLIATFTDGSRSVNVESAVTLASAASRPLGRELIEEKFGMLGETSFTLAAVDCNKLQEGLFLPLRELNDMRRRAIALLSGQEQDVQVHASPVVIEKPQRYPSGTPPRLAILTDRVEDFTLAMAAETMMFYEMPFTRDNYVEHYTAFFATHRTIQPWFPAVLIGKQFTDAVSLLEALKPSIIVSENSGIGWEASKRGISWVAGQPLNSVNSYALQAYQQFAGCSGAFISHELSREQMASIVAPADFSRWYTLFAPLLLMNTRQCIIRNIVDCNKSCTDEQCIKTCEKSATLSDDKNTVFNVVKRKGFGNQLYNNRYYGNPALVRDVDTKGAVFFIDLRSIPGKTEIKCSRQELVSLFEGLVAGNVRSSEIREVVLHTTAAQYTRGI